jgi:CBS domain-containing protein
MWWPVLGGVAIGVGGLIEPRALGVGYDNIAELLQGGMTTPATLRLVLVKAIIWSIALGSGTSGGVLAPLLIMGGALGAIFGSVMPVGEAGDWALIGMAAVMGGTMRSPLTAIVFAIEITHNLGALLPLTVACTMAHATTVLLLRRSILTEKLTRRGHHVMREYIVDPFETMRVSEIMAKPVDRLQADTPISNIVTFFTAPDAPPRHKSYPVVDDHGRVLRMIARSDALRWVMDGWPIGQPLRDLLSDRDLVTGYDDELVGHLADRMATADVSRVPILRRGDDTLVGLVARRDLLRVRASVLRHEREREVLIRFRALPELSAIGATLLLATVAFLAWPTSTEKSHGVHVETPSSPAPTEKPNEAARSTTTTTTTTTTRDAKVRGCSVTAGSQRPCVRAKVRRPTSPPKHAPRRHRPHGAARRSV